MANLRAELWLEGFKYEILSMSYGFHCSTNKAGSLSSGIQGGSIIVTIPSSDSTDIFYFMVSTKLKQLKGEIVIYEIEEQSILRRIQFEKSYLYHYQELHKANLGHPMTTELGLSPQEITIDKRLYITRAWPETTFGWQITKQIEDTPFAGKKTSRFTQIWSKMPWKQKENQVQTNERYAPLVQEEKPRIVSVELLRGNVVQTGTVIQYVNLPKEDIYLENSDIEHIDAMSQDLKVRVRFDTPGRWKFRIKLMYNNPLNAAYTRSEQTRNENFKYTKKEIEMQTDPNGEKLIDSGQLRVSPAGGDIFTIQAVDEQNRTVEAAAKVKTMRYLFYVQAKMEGLSNIPNNLKIMTQEFLKHGIVFKQLPDLIISHMHNIKDEKDKDFLIQQINHHTLGFANNKYCIRIAHIQHLITKGTMTLNYTVDAGEKLIKLDIKEEDGSGESYPLWQDVAPDEDWFEACHFLDEDDNKIIELDRSQCIPIQNKLYPPNYCDKVAIDISKLPPHNGTISLVVNYKKVVDGGMSIKNKNIVAVCTKAFSDNVSAEEQCQTIIHEIGHQLGLVTNGKGKLPDKTTYFYDNNKGHSGRHCHKGIPLEQARYDATTDSKKALCVMYGAYNKGNITFCSECAKALRKVDLSSGPLDQGVLT